MKQRIAKFIVRWISSAFDRSWMCWYLDQFECSDFWADVAKWREKYFLPVALKLDRDATVDQMIEETWWG